MHLKLQK